MQTAPCTSLPTMSFCLGSPHTRIQRAQNSGMERHIIAMRHAHESAQIVNYCVEWDSGARWWRPFPLAPSPCSHSLETGHGSANASDATVGSHESKSVVDAHRRLEPGNFILLATDSLRQLEDLNRRTCATVLILTMGWSTRTCDLTVSCSSGRPGEPEVKHKSTSRACSRTRPPSTTTSFRGTVLA